MNGNQVTTRSSYSLRGWFRAPPECREGTDLPGPEQVGRGLELALKARVLGPMQAIVSATSVSAGILRRPDLGSWLPAKTADVVAIDFDPLTDPDRWERPDHVVLVIKDGAVLKDTRR